MIGKTEDVIHALEVLCNACRFEAFRPLLIAAQADKEPAPYLCIPMTMMGGVVKGGELLAGNVEAVDEILAAQKIIGQPFSPVKEILKVLEAAPTTFGVIPFMVNDSVDETLMFMTEEGFKDLQQRENIKL